MRLRWGNPFCELCNERLAPGDLVAWWRVPRPDGRSRVTAYCSTCHDANLRAKRALH
jgi:hypothetical protein